MSENTTTVKKERHIGRKILAAFLGLILIVTVVADALMFHVYADALDKAFPGQIHNENEKTEAQVNALEVAEKMEAEGAVLLENNGGLPLQNQKINLLGYAAYHPVYGGTGSGGSSYLANRTDYVAAFQEAGIEINPALANVYQEDKEEKNTFAVDFSIKEPAATEALAKSLGEAYKYNGDASFDAMKDYSDTAVIVFSRKGGEGNDLPTTMEEWAVSDQDKSKHYLELNDAELSLLDQAKHTFANVVVLINTGNAMELGFLENEESFGPEATGDIDAAMWIGDPGDVGSKAIAKILKGEVNPSGKLPDIYPYAVETIPSMHNFDTYEYTNSPDAFADYHNHPAFLIEYQEGIYVGYRYYETRTSYDYVSREGETLTGLSYEDVVQYPFGYGLSYTTFSWDVTEMTEEGSIDGNSIITAQVEVKNVGEASGKDVVELYYTAPYDSEGSHIQKSSVVLGGYAKTPELAPGEAATVTIELKASDMASYDDQKYYSTTGSYVLEKGEYQISLRSDSHHVVNDFTYTYQLENSVVYADADASTNVEKDAAYVGARPGDQVIAVNQFEDVAGEVAYMDRDTWNMVDGSSKEATEEQLEAFMHAKDLDPSYINENDVAPVMGASNGVKLADLSGKAYDDALWDKLLDELTPEDYLQMLARNGWGSAEAASIGKNQIFDMDGPAALSYVFDAFKGTTTYKTISYPCEVILAASFNRELAEDFGEAIAKEAKAWSISGWYAPGINIHRNPFAGRNFEYYSEDPMLSGTMAAGVVTKAQENGLYCYMKHFVMNERETERHKGLCTWANEQSMREIYLAAFEPSVKSGKSIAMMSAYNNLGTTWAGASKALLTNVLRNEWGFIGTVITDNMENRGFMDPETAIVAGGTAMLCNGLIVQPTVDRLMETPSGQLLVREAAHQYLYTLANSFAVELKNPVPWWRMPAILGSVALYLISLIGLAVIICRSRKEKKK